jgi:hypothetical protein
MSLDVAARSMSVTDVPHPITGAGSVSRGAITCPANKHWVSRCADAQLISPSSDTLTDVDVGQIGRRCSVDPAVLICHGDRLGGGPLEHGGEGFRRHRRLLPSHRPEWLHFRSNGGIISWLPLFLFVVLFGLSMDYHVFKVSRIREAVRAVVMVGVFAVFGSLSSLDMKQLGVGLAIAVLIDATTIRAVVLPSLMTMLGDANWWWPG